MSNRQFVNVGAVVAGAAGTTTINFGGPPALGLKLVFTRITFANNTTAMSEVEIQKLMVGGATSAIACQYGTEIGHDYWYTTDIVCDPGESVQLVFNGTLLNDVIEWYAAGYYVTREAWEQGAVS